MSELLRRYNSAQRRGLIASPLAPPPPRPPRQAPQASAINADEREILGNLAAYRQQKQVQQQTEEEEDDGWGRGLGVIVNNPIVRGALKPLEVLDYGRRLVTLGVEEFAEGVTGQELQAMEGDTRSNMDKLKDPTYGVGQLLGGTLGDITPWEGDDQWVDRIGGFVGDIALDPLSWVTAGVGGVVGKSGRAMYASTARQTGRKLAEKALAEGMEETAAAAIRRQWDDAADYIGRYGPGSVKDPEVLKALNLPQQGLRFGSMRQGAGFRVGGNTKVGDALGEAARRVNRGVAGARAGLYDTRVGSALSSFRVNENVARAHEVIRSGKPQRGMEMAAALAITDFHRAEMRTGNSFRGRASKTFDSISKAVRGTEAQQATFDSERAGVRTAWNDYADELHATAAEYGLKIPYRENFVPHVVTEDGQALLRGDDELRDAFGITVSHLDDPSGVTMPRKYAAGEYVIQGVKVDFGDGSVDAINREMQKKFGVEKFLDDNITQIYSKYVKRLSSDVGLLGGLQKVADNFPELVVASDDPAGLLRIFQEIVDETATKTANKEIMPRLKARLTKANRAIGEAEDRALRSVMEGRSVLADEAGDNLSSLRTMRTETKQRLASLERTEKSAVKRRDKIVDELQGEIEDMDARSIVLRRELSGLRAREQASMEAIEGAEMSAERRSAAASRASRIRNARTQKEAELELLEQERELLDELNTKLRYAEVKEQVITGRMESTGITPRGSADGVPISDSFLGLAGGEQLVDEGYLTVGPAQRLYNQMMESGELEGLDPFTRNRIVGDAEREAAANLNKARQIDNGFKPEMEPAQRSRDEVTRDYAQRREQAETEWLTNQYNREPVAAEQPRLSKAERQKLARAKKAEQREVQALRELLDSDAGKQWYDEWSQIEDVRHLKNSNQWGRPQPLDPSGNPLRGPLQIQLDTAKDARTALRASTDKTTGTRRNVGAINDLQAQIRERQSQLAKIERQLEEPATEFGATKRVAQETPPIRRDVSEYGSTVGASDAAASRAALAGKARQFADEIRDMEERLADLMGVQNTRQTKPLNPGARKAKLTAADRKVAQLEAEVNRIRRKGQTIRNRVQRSEEALAKARKTQQDLAVQTLPPPRATPQPHLKLDEVIRRINVDEAEALRRLEVRERDTAFVPDRSLDTQARTMGRSRLPNRSQVEADIEKLEATRGRYSLPEKGSKAREILDSRQRAFTEGDGGVEALPRARNVLESSNLVEPYRSTLLEAGAITEAEAMRHISQEFKLREAIVVYEREGAQNSVNLRNVLDAADELRRTNEFLAKYAKVVGAGEAPSDALANRITRDIIDLDIKSYETEIARIKNNRSRYIDQEAEELAEALEAAIISLDDAAGLKQQANTIFRRKVLLPEEQIALAEERIKNNQILLDWAKKNLTLHRRRRTLAIKKGDDGLLARAERGIKNAEQSIKSASDKIAEMVGSIEELRHGAMTNDMREIVRTLESLADAPLTEEGAATLSRVLTDRQVSMLRHYSNAGTEGADFKEFVVDLLNSQGLPASFDAVARAPMQQLEMAVRWQASLEYERAKQLFGQVFEDLGFRRVGDLSMERSVGYNPSRRTYDSDVMKRVIAQRLERERGMSATDFAVRDLEARRNRLQTIRRGLGGEQRASAEMVGFTPEGRTVSDAIGPNDRLPNLDAGLDQALNDPMLPQERMKAVARAQRLQPIEEIRDARIAARKGATAEGPFMDLPFANWREMIFGEGAQMRPTMRVQRPVGEQAARGLVGVRTDIPHPSTAITRDSASAQARVLSNQLEQLDETQAKLQSIVEGSRRVRDIGGQAREGLEQSIAGREARIANELDPVLAEAGTPVLPEVDALRQRTQQGFDEKIGPREEELGQLEVSIAAREKAVDKVYAELNPKIAETRAHIREVQEMLTGKSEVVREMPPVGGYTDPVQMNLPGVPPAQGPQDLNRLALPAAGESSASRSYDERIAQAQEIADRVTKKRTAERLDIGGVRTIADDFNAAMADMGLPAEETALVRSLLADATGAEAEAELLRKGATALEQAISKAETNQLKVMTETILLPTYKQMAEVLTKGDVAADFYMHQSLATHFTRIDEAIKTNRFWKAVEAYTRFFKTYATARPDFHVRNGMSAMFMNTSDGVPIKYNFDAMQVWARMAKYDGDFVGDLRKNPGAKSGFAGLTNGQLADAIDVTWGTGAGGQFAERGVGGTTNRRIINNPITRTSKKVGEFVEGPVRLAMAMDSMKVGRTMDEAYERIARVHFDYSDVSRFDQYAKRIIPFWTFMSRNLPLQLTQMWTKPRAYAYYNSFVRNFRQEADPYAPEWWAQGGFPIAQGEDGTEDQTWFMPDLAHLRIGSDIEGALGAATLSDAGMLTSASPLFVTPVELLTKTDLFTGRQYDEADVEKMGGLESLLAPITNALGVSENGVINEQVIQAMRGLVPTWDQASRVAPGVTTGRSSEVDNERQMQTILRYLGLFPGRTLTPTVRENEMRNQRFDARQEQRVNEAMQRALVGS